MNELLGLPGSERYGACDDESAPKRPIRREKFRAGAACRQTGRQKQVYQSCGAHGSAAKKRRKSL